MGSLFHLPLRGPSVITDARPATSTLPTDTPSVRAWRAASADAALRSPGILVVHDAWGLDAEVRTLADLLAATGYTVLAPDLAAGWLPTSAAEAEALARSIDPSDASLVLAAAVDAIRADPAVGRQRVGAIGLGMGAPLAAFAATLRPDIAAVIVAGPGPDLPDGAWARTDAAFMILPPAEDEQAVADATAWADRLRAFGRETLVAPAPEPSDPMPEPATPLAAVDAALPGAPAFLERHLG